MFYDVSNLMVLKGRVKGQGDHSLRKLLRLGEVQGLPAVFPGVIGMHMHWNVMHRSAYPHFI